MWVIIKLDKEKTASLISPHSPLMLASRAGPGVALVHWIKKCMFSFFKGFHLQTSTDVNRTMRQRGTSSCQR